MSSYITDVSGLLFHVHVEYHQSVLEPRTCVRASLIDLFARLVVMKEREPRIDNVESNNGIIFLHFYFP